MRVFKLVYLSIAILILTPCITSFAQGKDIWVVGDREMDELPNEILNELQNDPYVNELLDLNNTEGNYTDKNSVDENIPNTVKHIKSIDGVNIANVLIYAKNIGVVVEKSLTDKFELDYIGVKDTNNFNFNDIIESDGTLKITVSANSQISNIDTTPNNKINVINIKIPEKIYNSFSIDIDTGSMYLPNIMGKVNIDSNKSSIKVIGNQLESNLNLNLQKSLLKFNVDKINNDINITGDMSSINIKFNQIPKNLKLDASKCENSIVLPDGWNKIYEIGTSKPKIDLNIKKGSTKIIVENTESNLEESKLSLQESIYNAKNLIELNSTEVDDLIDAIVNLSNSIDNYNL